MTRKKGRREGGFTFVELIIVIVILGILAVVAVPKFLSISGEAEKKVAQGITAALRGAVSVLHSQFLLLGTTYNASIVFGNIDTGGVVLNPSGTTATAQIGNATFTWSVEGPTLPTTMSKVVSSLGPTF